MNNNGVELTHLSISATWQDNFTILWISCNVDKVGMELQMKKQTFRNIAFRLKT